MVLESRNPQKISNDINYHLENVRLGVETLQLDYNRDKHIYLFCNKTIETLCIIFDLFNKTNFSLLISLALEINRLYASDPCLSIVNIQLINSKRPNNPDAVAYLKQVL